MLTQIISGPRAWTASSLDDRNQWYFSVPPDLLQALVDKLKKPKEHAAAVKRLETDFPNVRKVGAEWRIKGWLRFHWIDVKLVAIKATDPDLAGLRDPADPTRMNKVKRPVESA